MNIERSTLLKRMFHIVFLSLVLLPWIYPSWEEVTCYIDDYKEIGLCYPEDIGRKFIGKTTVSYTNSRGRTVTGIEADGTMLEVGPNYVEVLGLSGFSLSLWIMLSAFIFYRRKWLLLFFMLLSSGALFFVSLVFHCTAWLSSGNSG